MPTVIEIASALTLASQLVFHAPGPAVKAPAPVQYVKPGEKPVTIGVFEESFVTVQGLEGRLIVLPSILEEYKLRSGQEIDQATMYSIFERNQKLR
jgi:hypothetical protein